MSNPAKVGKSEWRSAIRKAQSSNDELRALLRKMMREGGPVIQALVGQAALMVLDSDRALDRLGEIGRNTERKMRSKSA